MLGNAANTAVSDVLGILRQRAQGLLNDSRDVSFDRRPSQEIEFFETSEQIRPSLQKKLSLAANDRHCS